MNSQHCTWFSTVRSHQYCNGQQVVGMDDLECGQETTLLKHNRSLQTATHSESESKSLPTAIHSSKLSSTPSYQAIKELSFFPQDFVLMR
ncbi:hypothetical protein RRG08_044639 [Elysia crispata]|uniref:Uncharacterized protein n=1 Tax=Elysia crispata TaxID=231223 RepID=A0AAE0YM27_9GAST|nr:hypothetical protein RRG08_044639 [Elysia crispata]